MAEENENAHVEPVLAVKLNIVGKAKEYIQSVMTIKANVLLSVIRNIIDP